MGNQGFLEQSWWQGVGGVFGILAFIIGVIALVVTIRQNKKKSLSYYVLVSESLLDIDEQIKESLRIQFQGHFINKLHVLRIRLINDGNVAITKNDFDQTPISLQLKNCNNMINCLVLETNPTKLKIETKFGIGDEVMIEPLLLNPGDFFDLKITFDGTNRNFSLNARIEGITRLKEIQRDNSPNDIFFSTETFLSIWLPMTVAYIGFAIISHIYPVPHSEIILVIGSTVAVFILLIKTVTERFTSKAKSTFDRRR